MPTNGFSFKPLKVQLLAEEQKATEGQWLCRLHRPPLRYSLQQSSSSRSSMPAGSQCRKYPCQLPSGLLVFQLFFGGRLPFKLNQQKRMPLFPPGHLSLWCSSFMAVELLFHYFQLPKNTLYFALLWFKGTLSPLDICFMIFVLFFQGADEQMEDDSPGGSYELQWLFGHARA